MSKSRVDTAPCRDREAVCFGGIASPHYSIYKRELAKKERSRGSPLRVERRVATLS